MYEEKAGTLRLKVEGDALETPESESALRQAAKILRAGGTVAFPTETVYGLGANALDARAVRKIFEAKQRPAWDPLIVHIATEGQLRQITAGVPDQARKLMAAFWPGPLTLLLPKAAALPGIVTAGRPRVGVRMPSDPVARRIIELAQLPIAAPSANSFGRTSSTRAEFVLEDLAGRIDAVVDSGQTALGLESTVVDACEHPPILYRPGMVTLEQLQAVCPGTVRYRAPQEESKQQEEFREKSSKPAAQASPGIGLKHYAPRARLLLLERRQAAEIFALADELKGRGETPGIMLPQAASSGEGKSSNQLSPLIYRWGRWDRPAELARRLFSGLRELDAAGATVILCPLPEPGGVGAAMRDRLTKAARRD